jgi:hypothetical protein
MGICYCKNKTCDDRYRCHCHIENEPHPINPEWIKNPKEKIYWYTKDIDCNYFNWRQAGGKFNDE